MLIILAVLLLGTTNVFSQEQTKTIFDVYMGIGGDAFERGDYMSAINWVTKALEQAKKEGENNSNYAASLNNLAMCYCEVGNYTKAIELYKQAIEIKKVILGETHSDYATSLDNLAYCYSKIGIYTQAIELHKQAIEIRKVTLGENHPNYATSLNNLALCYSGIGDYTQAIELNQQAIIIRELTLGDNHPAYATSLNNLALCYSDISDYTQAIDLYKQAIRIQKVALGENHPDYANSLANLAICYNEIGNYVQAIDVNKQAIEIRKVTLGESHPDYATSLGNLALCYCDIGYYNQAIELFEKAIMIQETTLGEMHPNYATSLNNLALCYNKVGNHNQAIKLHQQAISIREVALGKNHSSYANSLGNLASCYSNIGKYNKAIKFHKRAITIEKVALGEKHHNYIISLNNLASLYNKRRKYNKSIELYLQTFEITRDILGEDHPYFITLCGNLSYTYYNHKQYSSIPPIWNKLHIILKQISLSQFRDMTSAQRGMYWNSNILSSIVMPNNIYTKVLSNDKQSMGLSYNSLLFSKGVILASDIEFDKVIRESGDTVLLEKFKELRTTRAILNTYYNKPIAERPEGEVEHLEARAEVLEKDLLAGSKEYADFTRRLEIEWQDVQAALSDKDVAIEILAADEHIDEDTPPYYAALVLRKGWDAPKFVELCGAEVLKEYFADGKALALMYKEEVSKKLYNTIWGKLAEYIDEGDNVYFSPAGLLYQINVELLQDAEGRLANEKYNLHRVSSTRELCFEKPNIAHSAAVLYGGLTYDMDSTAMIAQSRAVRAEKEEFYVMRALEQYSLRGKLNHLPASEREVDNISQQMKAHNIAVALYKKEVGNEESFKALSGKKTPILHLATHGFFLKNEEVKVKPFYQLMGVEHDRLRPDNSLRRSGLAFAGAQKAWDGEETPKGIDDGIMLAQEIASMDLNGTDLVVLSACETGLGEINSEGVFGLQRAFKKAGVQTLIMSLWKVHDEATALFMQTFYENLLSGKSKRDSFAAAQMALREHKQYGADPYYWAGFIMLD